jgi:uroporphyrinogen decarboxylase
MQNTIFLQACQRQKVEHTPVWIMRQAGRYLPQYRAIRAKVDFLTLCTTPELAAEVTLQPVDILGVDAAIIFSDILVVPQAMGMELVVDEGKGGPRFPAPLRTEADIQSLVVPDPDDSLRFVLDAIRLARRELNNRVPLIGFSGSPWTLAAYMIEGRGTKEFQAIKTMMYSNPLMLHRLLDRITRMVLGYCEAQISAGAQAIQIFDTWGGILAPEEFKEFSLLYIEQIVRSIKKPSVPVIVFCKGAGMSLKEIAAIGADVVGLDWTIDIGNARTIVAGKVALQGNSDPALLYASPGQIREGVKKVLAKYGSGEGHIYNLGHGIYPDTPVEHAQAFVQAVQEESLVYHKQIV